jgi:hypothetical protein
MQLSRLLISVKSLHSLAHEDWHIDWRESERMQRRIDVMHLRICAILREKSDHSRQTSLVVPTEE